MARQRRTLPLPSHPPPLDVSGRPTALRDLDLDRLFHPRTVAVVGASDSPGSASALNYRIVRSWADRSGVRVYPVNPNRDEVDGERCYARVTDVPDDVDVTVVLVGAAEEALADAIEKKSAYCVIFTAGFAESGPEGAERQAGLEALIAQGDTRVLGPNTALNAFQVFRDDIPPPRLALITQSGQQGRPIYQAQDLGVGLAGWAPTGNEVDLESADFIRYFADRPDVGAIAAYIEGFKDGRTLMLAADHAARRGVPIVVVKVGRTDVGRSWARSHSGHLAGSDAVVSSVFDQFGITRVDGLDELLDTSAMLARTPPPAGDGVCIYAISGGAGAHVADLAAARGLRLPELTSETQRRLRQWIAGYLRITNPVDCGGHPAGDERGRLILETLLADPGVDALIVPISGFFPGLSDKLAEDVVAVAATTPKPVCVVWGSPAADEDAYRTILAPSGIPVFRSVSNCLGAVGAWFDYHRFRARYRSPFTAAPRRPLPFAERARAMLAGGTLSEHESKLLLSGYGIPVTREQVCSSAAEAVRAARTLGYPVVVKASGSALTHKSELDAVELGLRSDRDVREACARIADRTGSGLEGFLVSEMLTGGVETVVGIAHDETFGPTVMFGLGGIAVEVFRDVVFRVPPFDGREARRMVESIRSLPLLRGARGRPKANLTRIADVIMKVQRLAMDLAGELVELDVNPLLALPDRAVALDALAVGR